MEEINSKKRLLQKEIMRLHSEMSTNMSRKQSNKSFIICNFIGVPHLATCIFLLFSIVDLTRIEYFNQPGMALTPFLSSVG